MAGGPPSARALTAAGIGAVGTTFGMARYGYGLLLPAIQHSYHIGVLALGAIGAGSYASYLMATAVAGARAHALGPRATVVAGGLLASAGTLIAGMSHSAAALAVGIFVGGASCGAVFPPLADAVSCLPDVRRRRALSAMNCGTGYGVAVAAPLAIIAGGSWRGAWLGFATCALAATAWAARVLPGRNTAAPSPRHMPSVQPADDPPHADEGAVPTARPGTRPALRQAAPLMMCALAVGLGSAAYWTFAVDHLQRDGGLSVDASRAFLGVVGVASVLSTATGDVASRVGPRRLLIGAVALECASLVLLAVAPGSLPVALTSAILFGSSYNTVVAINSLWSAHLWRHRPSRGVAAALAANGTGLMCGPVLAGALGARAGLTGVMLGGAALLAIAALGNPPTELAGTGRLRAAAPAQLDR